MGDRAESPRCEPMISRNRLSSERDKESVRKIASLIASKVHGDYVSNFRSTNMCLLLFEYQLAVEPTWLSRDKLWFVVSLSERDEIVKNNNAHHSYREISSIHQTLEYFLGGLIE